MYADPRERIRASAVCTWVWVPTRAVTRPSRYWPRATFSLVASAWKSTKIRGVCRAASATRSSTIANEILGLALAASTVACDSANQTVMMRLQLAATIASAVERQLTQYVSAMGKQVDAARQAAERQAWREDRIGFWWVVEANCLR